MSTLCSCATAQNLAELVQNIDMCTPELESFFFKILFYIFFACSYTFYVIFFAECFRRKNLTLRFFLEGPDLGSMLLGAAFHLFEEALLLFALGTSHITVLFILVRIYRAPTPAPAPAPAPAPTPSPAHAPAC